VVQAWGPTIYIGAAAIAARGSQLRRAPRNLTQWLEDVSPGSAAFGAGPIAWAGADPGGGVRFRRLQRIATGLRPAMDYLSSPARLVPITQWFQILLGWVLATLFVAGLTGIVRKD
jgi:hypothetical protein